jgi:hypothetical protein
MVSLPGCFAAGVLAGSAGLAYGIASHQLCLSR